MVLNNSTTAETIWSFCISKGMNRYGASAVLASMDAESGLNSKNLQDSYQAKLGFTDDTYTTAVDNGRYTKWQFVNDCAGYSLCQWTYHTRKKALYEFAKSNNKSIGDLDMALAFFYKELSESYPSVLMSLKNATSLSQANDAMVSKYERPANIETAKRERLKIAEKYYIQFSNVGHTKEVIDMGYIICSKKAFKKLNEYFNSNEFDCQGNGCCSETLINEKLVEYLRDIRKHFNAPITITSAYRCTKHNRNVGGATGSRHTKGDAADIVVKGVAPLKVAQYAESIGIKGIGLYSNFVHIDTRDKKSFWYGHEQSYRSTFGTYSQSTNVGNTSNVSQSSNILRIGSEGDSVKSLQTKLIKLGYSCGGKGADGYYGNATYNAVRKFQDDNNLLPLDGIVGSLTLAAIDNAVAKLDAVNNDSYVGSYVKVTADVLNVRSGAGLNNKITARIVYDTVCMVVEEKENWCKLSSLNGWVSKDYIKKV